MVAEVKTLHKELTDTERDVLACLQAAKEMNYDQIFIMGIKDGMEWLHHNGFETLEMVGRLEGLKYSIWMESQN